MELMEVAPFTGQFVCFLWWSWCDLCGEPGGIRIDLVHCGGYGMAVWDPGFPYGIFGVALHGATEPLDCNIRNDDGLPRPAWRQGLVPSKSLLWLSSSATPGLPGLPGTEVARTHWTQIWTQIWSAREPLLFVSIWNAPVHQWFFGHRFLLSLILPSGCYLLVAYRPQATPFRPWFADSAVHNGDHWWPRGMAALMFSRNSAFLGTSAQNSVEEFRILPDTDDNAPPWQQNLSLQRFGGEKSGYPLVMTNIAMENHHFWIGQSIINGLCSSSQTVSLPEGKSHSITIKSPLNYH